LPAGIKTDTDSEPDRLPTEIVRPFIYAGAPRARGLLFVNKAGWLYGLVAWTTGSILPEIVVHFS
jgi:hypothetical protein